jgi:DNA-binding beta-propeller fold protein YncE
MGRNRAALFFMAGFFLTAAALTAQEVMQGPVDEAVSGINIAAEEEFSWGVRAFHEGQYNKAFVNFERALSLNPRNARYRLWSGFASYYAGLDDSAIKHWQTILDDKQVGGAWLRNKVDTLLYRKSPYFYNLGEDGWTERGSIEEPIRGVKNIRFSRPTSVKADPISGGAFVVGYANNSVAKYDVNGNLLRQYKGMLVEFDGPYDVLPLTDGRFFVSEFSGNRISLINERGFRINTFGTKAEEGALRGPQFLAADENGFLYVTDWSSKRVVKYNYDGEYIMDIGRPGAGFAGLGSPAGIAVGPTEIYVADRSGNVIYVFDLSGNYIREIGRGIFINPEGLNLFRNNYLLVADGRRVMMVDLLENTIIELTNLDGRARQITQTAFDRNSNLMLVDNQANRLVFLSRLSNLYGGLMVNIQRIFTDSWPTITVEATVQNRAGESIIGLKEENFLVYENGLEPKARGLETADYQVGSLDVPAVGQLQGAVMVEASPEAGMMGTLMVQGLRDIYKDIHERGSLNFYWAAESPVAEHVTTDINAVALYNRKHNSLESPMWRFDAALRLAASSLIPQSGRQALFFITTGLPGTASFMQYKPDELASYLKNNGIAFYPIYVDNKVRNENYDYIARETGGMSSYLYRPEGLGALLDIARSQPSGVYTITYHTTALPHESTKFIDVSLEVALQRESGSTRSGYYPPLQ